MRGKLKHEGKEKEKERGQRRKRHLSSELCFQFLVTDTLLQRPFSALLFSFYSLLSNTPVLISPFTLSSSKQGKHYRNYHVQKQQELSFRKKKGGGGIRKIKRFNLESCSKSLRFMFHLQWNYYQMWNVLCIPKASVFLYILYYWD